MSRITVEDLKVQTGVEDWQLSLECRDEHLLDITKHIGNYTRFASRMNLYESVIQTIVANLLWPTHGQKAEQVFKEWKKNSKATYLEFVKICLELSEGDVAREMCKHCARIKTVNPGKNEVDAPVSRNTSTQKAEQWPTATEAQLSEECSDEALKDLSNVLSSYHSYRYMLGLTDVEINEIDNDPRTFYSSQAKFFSALKKWKSKNIDFDCPSRSNATYARLLEIAKKARDGQSVRQINKVCVEAASKGSEYVTYCKPKEESCFQQLEQHTVETTPSRTSSNPHSLEGWFREVGLMDKDIDTLANEGYATKQAFSLLTISELNDLKLTNGGKRLLKLRIQANESSKPECIPKSAQAGRTESPSHLPAPVQAVFLNTHTHLGDIYSRTFEARTKWFNIGLQLGVPKHTLDSISTNTHLYNDEDYYREMLKCWMKEGSAKMSDLVEVLEGPTVQMFDVAKKARELDNKTNDD